MGCFKCASAERVLAPNTTQPPTSERLCRAVTGKYCVSPSTFNRPEISPDVNNAKRWSNSRCRTAILQAFRSASVSQPKFHFMSLDYLSCSAVPIFRCLSGTKFNMFSVSWGHGPRESLKPGRSSTSSILVSPQLIYCKQFSFRSSFSEAPSLVWNECTHSELS